MSFPVNPVVGQTYLNTDGQTFVWTAQGAWKALSSGGNSGFVSPQTMHTGITAPSNTLGQDGDYYLRLDTGQILGPKAGGVWPLTSSLNVLQTDNLHMSVGAPSGSLGSDGDYYIDFSTKLLWGPRSGGNWPGVGIPFIGDSNAIIGNSNGIAPLNSIGNNGDYFQDVFSGIIFGPKNLGSWPGSSAGGTGHVTVSDINYSVPAGVKQVTYGSLTATRFVTLPLAANVPAGYTISVDDSTGLCTPTNEIITVPSGSDTIGGALASQLLVPFGSIIYKSNGSNLWTIVSSILDPTVLAGSLNGLTMTWNSGTQITVSPGAAASDDSTTLMTLPSGYVNTTGNFVVGSGNGALDTGSMANTTEYFVFLIERTDTGIVDILFSTSATAPIMPSGYSKKRRIGAFRTDGSANILKFSQSGDAFLYDIPLGVGPISVTTTAQLITFPIPSLPSGITATYKNITTYSVVAQSILFTSPAASTQVANTPTGNVSHNAPGAVAVAGSFSTGTVNGQIRAVSSVAGGLSSSFAVTGWIDTRGQS